MPPHWPLRRCCACDITSVSTSSSANQDRGNRHFGEAPVDFRCDSGAGHFTYMDSPPLGAMDAHPDRAAFLRELASDLRAFARG